MHQVIPLHSGSFRLNRTLEELKLGNRKITTVQKLRLNRTLEELKSVISARPSAGACSLNRTVEELKYKDLVELLINTLP